MKDIILKRLLEVFLVSVTYGIVIEIVQEVFTKTRKADIMDVLANAIGGLIAVIGFLLYKNFLQKQYIAKK
jgi:VanZ family protein